jgi:hypothetical protein
MIIVEHRVFGPTPQTEVSDPQHGTFYREKNPSHALRKWKTGAQPNIRRYLRVLGIGGCAVYGLGLVFFHMKIGKGLDGEGAAVPIGIMSRPAELCCAEHRGTRQ